MNTLLDLREKLLKTGAALGRLESELPLRPDSRGLASNILSLKKLHQSLQHEFQEAADDVGLDVCHYRLLDDRPTARAFSSAIGAFQSAFSLAYDAIRNGPKDRRNLSADVAYKTELRLAYTYPGSFGVVFTIPNSRLMLDMPTYLDEAARTVFSVAVAKSNTEIVSGVARQVGRAPIAAIYDWAKGNAQNNSGAVISWTRKDSTKEKVTVQAPEFRALSETMERTSEKIVVPETTVGTLVGADIKSHRFHFVPDDETQASIKGRFSDAISEKQKARLPARYAAMLQKTVTIRYATEVEDAAYFLLRLDQAPPRP